MFCSDAAVASSHPHPSTPAAAGAESLFDEELDMPAPASTQHQPTCVCIHNLVVYVPNHRHRQVNPTQFSAALTSTPRDAAMRARQDHCMQVVAAAIPLHPAAAANAIVAMWRHTHKNGSHGTAMVRRLAAMLVDCWLRGGRHHDTISLVCGDHAAGLLTSRPTDVVLRCAATQLERLLRGARHGASLGLVITHVQLRRSTTHCLLILLHAIMLTQAPTPVRPSRPWKRA